MALSTSNGRPSSSHGGRSERLTPLPPPPAAASSFRAGNGVAGQQHQSYSRSRASTTTSTASSRRSVTPTSRTRSPAFSPSLDNDSEPGRVRVAVRLRPRNAEDVLTDSDYADCVEMQPELKKLKMKKNNWSSESYRFDEVFAESASQKRVYDAVAKPVVESVLDGYNGTVMAYGQTGTGKTYTLGQLGKDDVTKRGIMARALEDVIVNTSPETDSVEISYLQLYMESLQDLLAPEKINIPIVEDAKTGEVLVPGATSVKIQDLHHFLQLLQTGEANRYAANTKLNTESSRSHAILMVSVRRSVKNREESDFSFKEKYSKTDRHGNDIPIVRKSKLLIVDLAGSERLDKSGSEGHLVDEAKFINLSLTSLGKCINAVAENSLHIPTRDSKLTRLLRDSFGGSARTSLIITVGPSSRHYAETLSTIMFGQRAMKIVNTVKVKEEFDYERLCRKLETQVDHLIAQIDMQQKLRSNDQIEMERKLRDSQTLFAEAEKNLVARSEFLEKENNRLQSEVEDLKKELNSQKDLNSSIHNEIAHLESNVKKSKFLEKENTRLESELKNVLKDLNEHKDHNDVMRDKVAHLEMNLKHNKQHQLESSTYQKVLADTTQMYEKKIADLMKQLEDEQAHFRRVDKQQQLMKEQLDDLQNSLQMENTKYQKAISDTTKTYEEKIAGLVQQLEDEGIRFKDVEGQLTIAKRLLDDHKNSFQIQSEKEVERLRLALQDLHQLHETTAIELQTLKTKYQDLQFEKESVNSELHSLRQTLQVKEKPKNAEDELLSLKKAVPESEDAFDKSYTKQCAAKGSFNMHRSCQSRETMLAHRNTVAKIIEEVGLQKLVSLLTAGDLEVQIHAVKVVANLAAEDNNREKIVQEGGLDALLMLLQSSENAIILRVASGAIANLAMNEMNQDLIVSKGGVKLLANTASRTDDPQTLRMVAGAISNLCGNEKLHVMLRQEGAIRALLEMARSGNIDTVAQVSRGLANFAKCESRGTIQGHRRGCSLLLEDGVLAWLITNSNNASATTRRHIELALCHLAQNDDNAKDFISSGALQELVRISNESVREDIRNLAKKTLKLNPTFQSQRYMSNEQSSEVPVRKEH
ncbi:kinesin-like protein KIN-UC isoform X2 [Ipomoea triloba]|uniref:kinesin-like protein KIN-UC isoform X2 n=1 Tax=Ipomoea triloba TaxID=35885 RepID=UPI00125DE9E2|nr:kinesin-like protein KIN-UC isoform X2 [Ipomoea triloba]